MPVQFVVLPYVVPPLGGRGARGPPEGGTTNGATTSGAIDHLANDRLQLASGALRITGDHGLAESGDLFPFDEVDGGAAKAAARQAGAQTSWMTSGQFH